MTSKTLKSKPWPWNPIHDKASVATIQDRIAAQNTHMRYIVHNPANRTNYMEAYWAHPGTAKRGVMRFRWSDDKARLLTMQQLAEVLEILDKVGCDTKQFKTIVVEMR